MDHDGSIIYSNQSAHKITCRMGDDGIGGDAGSPIISKKIMKEIMLPSIEKSGIWESEIIIKDRDGNNFTVWISAFPAHGDAETSPLIICIIRDHTERNILETALQLSVHKYMNLLGLSGDGIFVCDISGRLLDTNQKMADLFGYPHNNLLSLFLFDLVPEDQADQLRTMFRMIVKETIFHSSVTFRKRNDALFTAELSASYIKMSGEELIQGTITKVSETNQPHSEYRKHRDKLEATISERTHELIEANENLQIEIKVRKEAEKKLLRYQKQLQSLSSQIAMIEEREKRRIAAELHDCIGQALALIKIKLGLFNKLSDSVEFRDMMKEILALTEQAIKETRTLTFELSPPILYELGLRQALQWLVDQFRDKYGIAIEFVNVDGDMSVDNNIRFIIFQAVRELLINVVKHSQARKVLISLSKFNNGLKIIVEDDGKGFLQSSTAYSGYGLFNIRERMNHINGRFDIKSTPGVGTRVTIITPLDLQEINS